jgi:hypothetical protein
LQYRESETNSTTSGQSLITVDKDVQGVAIVSPSFFHGCSSDVFVFNPQQSVFELLIFEDAQAKGFKEKVASHNGRQTVSSLESRRDQINFAVISFC